MVCSSKHLTKFVYIGGSGTYPTPIDTSWLTTSVCLLIYKRTINTIPQFFGNCLYLHSLLYIISNISDPYCSIFLINCVILSQCSAFLSFNNLIVACYSSIFISSLISANIISWLLLHSTPPSTWFLESIFTRNTYMWS